MTMNNSDQMSGIMEAFYNAAPYGMPGEEAQAEERESVTYSKTKSKGDAQVTVSANADNMEELHDILRLAGITLPGSDKGEEHDHEEHGEEAEAVCDTCGAPESECECDGHEHGEDEMPCDSDEPKMKVISLKPQSDQGYNGMNGDKKEILHALMNRYKSL